MQRSRDKLYIVQKNVMIIARIYYTSASRDVNIRYLDMN